MYERITIREVLALIVGMTFVTSIGTLAGWGLGAVFLMVAK